MPVLLRENNVVSLRTAYVHDNGYLVSFCLDPADLTSLIPKGRDWWAPKDFDWVSKDSAWLYRHLRSPSEEEKLTDALPCVDQDIISMAFERPPEFKLTWADSGQSVAIILNGEPWAFIDETSHEGYSKGILKPRQPYLSPVGKQWDQELFERIFLSERRVTE